jgi:hypothetical protein
MLLQAWTIVEKANFLPSEGIQASANKHSP